MMLVALGPQPGNALRGKARQGRRTRGAALRLWATAAAGCLCLCACTGVRGSGTTATEKRPIGEFVEIEASGVLEVHLSLQKPLSLELSGDDNLLPLVTTEVSGKRLVIGSKQNLSPKLPLVATISAPNAELVRCSGACEIVVTDAKNDKLALELTGAGKISASGETKELRLEISGSGSASTEALRAGTVSVRLSGAGDAAIGPSDKLDAEISGAGSVSYQGEPTVTKRISGAGSIRHK